MLYKYIHKLADDDENLIGIIKVLKVPKVQSKCAPNSDSSYNVVHK